MIVSHYLNIRLHDRLKRAKLCTFVKYRPLVGNEHVGKIRSPRGGARRCLLGLSSTTLFLVLFKYLNVIIKKIDFFFVVGLLNITAS